MLLYNTTFFYRREVEQELLRFLRECVHTPFTLYRLEGEEDTERLAMHCIDCEPELDMDELQRRCGRENVLFFTTKMEQMEL